MRRKRAGFTLVELMEVILIMGILFGLVLTAVNQSLKHAKKEKTKAVVRTLASAFRSYRYEYQKWPTDDNPDSGSQVVDYNNHPMLMQYMENNNPLKVSFINEKEYARDSTGYFLDAWSERLKITIDFTNDTVKVTSSGRDKVFNGVDNNDNRDDISQTF